MFSLNAIAPIFVLVVVGAVLKKIKFADDSFFSVCDKLCFKICLPCLLFLDIAEASFSDINPKLMVFCGAFVLFMFFTSGFLAPIFLKNNGDRGAFIQGVCRSNAAILGVTVAENLFGKAGSGATAAVLPIVIALYNISTVIVLSIFAPKEKKLTGKGMLGSIVKNIAKNPLILAVLAGLLWNVSGIGMPLSVSRSLDYLGNMSAPLALLSMGAGFSFKAFRADAGKVIVASCVKTIIYPALAVIGAVLLGFTDVSLGVVLVIFGSPTAVASFVMAKQMDSNYSMARDIILLTTLMSAFTMFLEVFILRTVGLI